jgi:hypothetical protein
MLRLEGAVVHLNATDHLVISFAGYTAILPMRHGEAEVLRAVEADRAGEAEMQTRRSKQTATAREAHRVMAATNAG